MYLHRSLLIISQYYEFTHPQNCMNDDMFYLAFSHVRNSGQPRARVMDEVSKAI